MAREVAVMLGVDAAQLKSWRNANVGPHCFKVGKNWLYRRSTLLEWMTANGKEAAASSAA